LTRVIYTHKVAPHPPHAAAAAAAAAAGPTPKFTVIFFFILRLNFIIIFPPQPTLSTQLLLHTLQRGTL
jgi:hypothetical protein